jgi:hypothetical protein
MESRLARIARESLLERVWRLSPEQRLIAFYEHCRLLARLREAELSSRRAKESRGERDAS